MSTRQVKIFIGEVKKVEEEINQWFADGNATGAIELTQSGTGSPTREVVISIWHSVDD
ncbi:MAG TPA: hypothetical protein VJJ20_00575 [Candidatus Paceibacterota bacterium]